MKINYKKIKIANQQRIDIFIRILFIEWYYKKNDYGDRLYKQMREISNLNHKMWKERFIKLIQSFEENGFDKTKPLQITNNYRLCNDGAHRLACIIYFNITNVPVQINYTRKINFCDWYGEKWLKENFNETDSKFILDMYLNYINK